MDMKARYDEVRLRIARAAERAGRPASDVTIIAVSKSQPARAVREAAALGLRDFGENKVQELEEKRQILAELPVRWHFIGHLQTNKVRRLLPHAVLIHSVDSVHLARRIDELAPAAGRPVDGKVEVCLQINTSAEASKFGAPPRSLGELAATACSLPRLRVRGLMTLGPLTEDRNAVRASFRMLRELLPILHAHIPDAPVLSMGMSGDYEIAVEEGATHVRVGTALFGPRA